LSHACAGLEGWRPLHCCALGGRPLRGSALRAEPLRMTVRGGSQSSSVKPIVRCCVQHYFSSIGLMLNPACESNVGNRLRCLPPVLAAAGCPRCGGRHAGCRYGGVVAALWTDGVL